MTESQNAESATETNPSFSYDPEDFVEVVTSFPCFADARLDKAPEEVSEMILNAYRDDNLTEEQDLVIELIFHLSDENTPFNLKRACELWSDEDMEAFWYVIAPEDVEQNQ